MSKKRKDALARTERERGLCESGPYGDALQFEYRVRVLGELDLEGEWRGWRLRGRWLISPAGDRINPQRLAGLLFTETNRDRLAKLKRAAGKGRPDPGPIPLDLAKRVQGGALR